MGGAAFLGAECQYNVATSSFDQKVRIYDMRDRTVVETLQEHYDDVIGIDFCEARRWLASGSDDGSVCIWDTRAWHTPLFKIDTRKARGVPADNEVKRVKFNPDGSKLATGSNGQHVLVYDLAGAAPEVYGILAGGHGGKASTHTDCVFDCCY